MNDFLSSIWIYFFSCCLSFQLNCSSHLLRRSGRSPPNLASEADGIPWRLSVDNSSFGDFFGKKNAWNRCGASAYNKWTGEVQLKLEWGSGVFNTQAQGKVPETKATTELYILWMHHRKLQDCWHNETLFWDIDLHFALNEWHQRAPSQKLTHFPLKHFQGSCFLSKCPRLYLEYINCVYRVQIQGHRWKDNGFCRY